ncbi:MAG: T9SS type A sorting domain-containing protein, partial [Ignavibacteria bacterium]
ISSVRGNDDAPAEGITQSLMPNPAGESITVSLNVANTAQRAELVITDVQGQVVITLFSAQLDAGNHVIHADVSMLAAGSYLVSLRTPTGMVTSPLRIVR